MSYRCGVCRHPSRPGQSMLRHMIYRILDSGRHEIAQEVPLCYTCADRLASGDITYQELVARHRRAPAQIVADSLYTPPTMKPVFVRPTYQKPKGA